MSTAQVIFWVAVGLLVVAAVTWAVVRSRGRYPEDGSTHLRDIEARARRDAGHEHMTSPPDRADRPAGPGAEAQRVASRGQPSPGPEPAPVDRDDEEGSDH